MILEKVQLNQKFERLVDIELYNKQLVGCLEFEFDNKVARCSKTISLTFIRLSEDVASRCNCIIVSFT